MNHGGSPLHRLLRKRRWTRDLAFHAIMPRSRGVVKRLLPHLQEPGRTLDIGSGSGTVTSLLIDHGLDVFPLDIHNISFSSAVTPTMYDGYRMPFRDNAFGTSLLVFVLHHTPDPVRLLAEARRVSRRILVLEDIIVSGVHKVVTAALDSILNVEFLNQPHSNKRDGEWRRIFEGLNLRLRDFEYRTFGLAMRHAIYSLEK